MKSRVGWVAVGAAVVLGVAGCGSSGGGGTQATSSHVAVSPTTVVVNHMAFRPAVLTVHVGDTVTWRFEDRFPHSVQGVGPNARDLNSPLFDKGGVWTYQFTAAGIYHYMCPLHPDMHGTVVVQ